MSQRSAHTSLARSPWRWARGIMAASRCGLRAPMRLRAVAMSRSASSRVRYSRGRRAALGRRRGGTFPFTVVGPLPCVTRFPSRLLGAGSRTFPFMGDNGKVASGGIGWLAHRPLREGGRGSGVELPWQARSWASPASQPSASRTPGASEERNVFCPRKAELTPTPQATSAVGSAHRNWPRGDKLGSRNRARERNAYDRWPCRRRRGAEERVVPWTRSAAAR
jgi:hypothetical protein